MGGILGKVANVVLPQLGVVGGGLNAAIQGEPIGKGALQGGLNAIGSIAGQTLLPMLGNTLSSSFGDVFGKAAGSVVDGGVGPSLGTGINGAINTAGRVIGGLGDTLGGLAGGGGSTFSGGNLLSTALGAYSDDRALKKAQEQLLAGNQQQLENIASYEPGAYLENPEYQYKLAEGEKALNRSLGAQGGLFSGKALQAAADYSKGLNTDFQQRDYQQYVNRVGMQNPLYGNSADTRAATGIARSNVFGDALSNVLNPQQGMSADQLAELLKLRG